MMPTRSITLVSPSSLFARENVASLTRFVRTISVAIIDRLLVGLGELWRAAGADRLDRGRIDAGLDGKRRVGEPLVIRFPECAGDADRQFREARRQARAEAAIGAE